jgi:hypothetical protein
VWTGATRGRRAPPATSLPAGPPSDWQTPLNCFHLPSQTPRYPILLVTARKSAARFLMHLAELQQEVVCQWHCSRCQTKHLQTHKALGAVQNSATVTKLGLQMLSLYGTLCAALATFMKSASFSIVRLDVLIVLWMVRSERMLWRC